MTGAEYVAEFLAQRKIENVFLLTGGACVFMVDAIGQHPEKRYNQPRAHLRSTESLALANP